jgi:predicted transcriptional regulator of viral defense system
MHMKIGSHPKARQYIEGLTAIGRYHFSSKDARTALGVSPAAAKLALARLAKQKLIASPARGFYVVVPSEYRALGCLPADQFIPALMERAGLPYYAGLLSAAQYFGAAHHRPQVFQVMLEKARRPIHCGQVRVSFVLRKNLKAVPKQMFNTARGLIEVSTREGTAFDLVGYQRHVGGLDQVATVLAELAEHLDSEKLAAAARTAPLPWAQRLGYLLERVGAADKAAGLKRYIQEMAREPVLLLPGASSSGAQRATDWRIIVNAEVEAET